MCDTAAYHDQVFLRGRACLGLPLEIFNPGPGGRFDMAASVCASCPVIDRCEHYFLGDEESGYVAGMTIDQRRKKRKALHRKAS